MIDKNHPPVHSIFGARLLQLGIPYLPIPFDGSTQPVRGCNERFGPPANDDKEKPSRA